LSNAAADDAGTGGVDAAADDDLVENARHSTKQPRVIDAEEAAAPIATATRIRTSGEQENSNAKKQ